MLKIASYGRYSFRMTLSNNVRRSIFVTSSNFMGSLSQNVSGKYSPWHFSRLSEGCCLLNGFSKISFSSSEAQLGSLSKNEFELICSETLESLSDYFEELIEKCGHLKGCDVTYSDGVLTIQFGNEFGTYVINRQTPNHQIWLSSPTSGPKRYDFVPGQKQWIYRHDNKSLHELLQQEIPKIVQCEVNFNECAYSGT